jgi:hypothetical protein
MFLTPKHLQKRSSLQANKAFYTGNPRKNCLDPIQPVSCPEFTSFRTIHPLLECDHPCCPRGTYLPYFRTFFLKLRFRLKAPSMISPLCTASRIASASCASSGEYRLVTLPGCPALPVRPTCGTKRLSRENLNESIAT